MERVPVEGPAADVGAALARRRFMIVSAESCTGGGIGAALTAIAGSLASFDRGLEPWPNCGGALKIIAAIVDPVLMIRLVAHRGVPTRAPPRLTARRLDSRPSCLILTETSSTPAPMLTLGLCSQNEVLQRAFSTFILHNLYQTMFRRGTQDRITHAVIFDEAHRAAKLKLIPTMAKECRKFGLAFVVASQEVKDFDQSLFTAIANYLALRVNEADAKLMAKIFAPSDQVTLYADRIKQIAKFRAWFYTEGMRTPVQVILSSDTDK